MKKRNKRHTCVFELPDILGDLLLRLVWLTLTFFCEIEVGRRRREKRRFELLPQNCRISFNTENQMQNWDWDSAAKDCPKQEQSSWSSKCLNIESLTRIGVLAKVLAYSAHNRSALPETVAEYWGWSAVGYKMETKQKIKEK